MRAHWCHLANTIEVVLPSAHPRPQPKRQIDRFSHFFAQMTAEYPYTLQGTAPSSLKIAHFHGNLDPHLICGSLGQPESST